MKKMYIEDNAGYRALLITDGKKWYYFNTDCNGKIGDIDFYPDDYNPAELVKTVREGIENGAIYSADDFLTDVENIADHYISEFDNMTISDIDTYYNYTSDGRPKGHDVTTWWEV